MPLVEGCKHEIELEVPVAVIETEEARIVADMAKRANLPGFRPGKVPPTIIRQRFKEAIRQEVVEAVVPKEFNRFADENKVAVVGNPNVNQLTWEPGQPIKFKAQYEVMPEFELRDDYRGVEAIYNDPTVADEEIDQRLQELRERKAEFVNIDPRAAVAGDHVLVDMKSLEGLAEPIEEKGMELELGAETTLPEFTENIVGLSPGEDKTFEVKYPDEYGSERLAGKTVKFQVTLTALRKKELPELNDEFAQDLGDFKTLDELKDALKKGMYSEKARREQELTRTEILDKLVELYDFPLPQAFVDQQAQGNLERRLNMLMGQGIDPRQLNLDWAALRKSQEPQARKDVKASLLLGRIADREAITASNDEVDAEVQRIARSEREAVAATRRRLEQDGTLNNIAANIRTEKVLAFLFEQAKKVAGERKQPEPEPEAAANDATSADATPEAPSES